MKRFLILFLFCAELLAQQGTITDIEIQPDGFRAFVFVEGMQTNGSFFHGLNTTNLNISGNEKFVLTVLGATGFNDTKDLISVKKTVIGKDRVRFPYPSQAFADTVYDAVSNKARFIVSLDKTIYTNETASANILSGLYVNGTTNSLAASSVPVSNLSTQIYVKPYARWVMEPFRPQTNNIAELRLFAIGNGAKEGRPVRVVEFWVTDESANSSSTSLVTQATFRRAVAVDTQLPIGGCFYQSSIDISGLTVGETLTCHARVYPWIGDVNSILASDDGAAFPDERFCNWNLFCDKNETFGGAVAHVNGATGVDATGVAAAPASYANAVAAPFATITGAITAIGRTNWLLYARSDVQNSVVYLTNATYTTHGPGNPTITNNTSYKTWLTIRPAPGVASSDVIFTGTGSRTLANITRLYGLTLSQTAGQYITMGNIVVENCIITNNTSASLINTCTNVWFVRNRVSSLAQGLFTAGTSHSNWRMIGENDVSDYVNSSGVWPACLFSNYRNSGTNSGGLRIAWPSSGLNAGVQYPSYPMVVFNYWGSQMIPTGGHVLQVAEPQKPAQCTNGIAVVQNLVEQISSDPNASRVMSISASTSGASSPDTNAFYNFYGINNTFLGQRGNIGEGAGYQAGVPGLHKSQIFFINNYNDSVNSKDDIDYTQNTSKTNGWETLYTVNWTGNVDIEPNDMDSAWHWGPATTKAASTNHFSMNSYYSGGIAGSGTNSTWYLYAKFVNPRRGTSSVAGGMESGGGDYRMIGNSALVTPKIPTEFILPFDIFGKPRGLFDEPGAVKGWPEASRSGLF